MPTRITVYRRVMTRGQYVGEIGTSIQLEPWGGNTDRYEAYDESVPADLADGWHLLPSTDEDRAILYRPATEEVVDDVRVAIGLGILTIRD